MKDEDKLLEWLLHEDTMELADRIESVNKALLQKYITESDFVVAFFYRRKNCPECQKFLIELENIDDDAEKDGIDFVKTSDEALARHYGAKSTPALIYFRHEEPIIYHGDLMNEEQVLKWLLANKGSDDGKDVIEDVNRATLIRLIENQEFVTVFFYEKNCKECDTSKFPNNDESHCD